MQVTIKNVSDFYKIFPEYKGKINVKTRYGYKSILEAGITAYNERIYKLKTQDFFLEASAKHLVNSNGKWVSLNHLNPNDNVETERGTEKIIDIFDTGKYDNLYDIQVEDVKEYYSNGIISHNSTIADALKFVLYGETIRPLKKDDIINKVTKKGCAVVLDFDVTENKEIKSYILTRTLAPSHIKLIRVDPTDRTKKLEDLTKSIPETTISINNIISTTAETFENTIIMSINGTEPFMAQKGVAKKKFIEGIFKLSIFSDMLKLIKEDLTKIKTSYDMEKMKIDELLININRYKDRQKEELERQKTGLRDTQQKIADNDEKIKTLYAKIVKIDLEKEKLLSAKTEALYGEQKKCDTQIRDYIHESSTRRSTINRLSSRQKELESLGAVCTECKRPYPDVDLDARKASITEACNQIVEESKEVGKIKDEIEKIETLKEQCIVGIKKIVSVQHEIDMQKRDNENVLSQIKQIDLWTKQLNQDIEKQEKQGDNFADLIKESELRLETLNKSIGDLSKQLKILDLAKFITSEEGVKSFIVKKLLKLLNDKLSYYLRKHDANALCAFDEYFEEQIYNEKKQPCSYYNFSGGERKRIDLSMLFTFRDIRRLQSTVTMNLSMYDELLDSSLDQKGIDCVLEILKQHVDDYGEAIYVISHKSEAVKHVTGDIIYLEKMNGITRRLDYGTSVQTTNGSTAKPAQDQLPTSTDK